MRAAAGLIGERGTQHWSSSFEMVQIFLIQDDSYILRGIKAVHIHSNKFRACHCGMPASQPWCGEGLFVLRIN